MSAPFDHALFAMDSEPLMITATLWRGAMIDRFACVEDTVLLCLRALRASAIAMPSGAFQQGAKTRLRALIEVLNQEDFGEHGKAALRSLNQLFSLYDCRTSLAHGRIKTSSDGIEIEWVHPGSGDSIHWKHRYLTLIQIVDELATLDQLHRDLSSRLGQIRQLATDRARL